LLFLVEAYSDTGDWDAADTCLDILPMDPDPFLKRLLRLHVVVGRNQVFK
jgi:hypothetical protein